MVSQGGGAVELQGSYLRVIDQQRIKIGPHTSAWEDLIQRCPSGIYTRAIHVQRCTL